MVTGRQLTVTIPVTTLQTLFRFYQVSTNAPVLFQSPIQDPHCIRCCVSFSTSSLGHSLSLSLCFMILTLLMSTSQLFCKMLLYPHSSGSFSWSDEGCALIGMISQSWGPSECSMSGSHILLLFSHSVMSHSFVTPWTVACQVPLTTGFPRQESWSGLPFSSPGDLSDTGTELISLHYRWILYHWATISYPSDIKLDRLVKLVSTVFVASIKLFFFPL